MFLCPTLLLSWFDRQTTKELDTCCDLNLKWSFSCFYFYFFILTQRLTTPLWHHVVFEDVFIVGENLKHQICLNVLIWWPRLTTPSCSTCCQYCGKAHINSGLLLWSSLFSCLKVQSSCSLCWRQVLRHGNIYIYIWKFACTCIESSLCIHV